MMMMMMMPSLSLSVFRWNTDDDDDHVCEGGREGTMWYIVLYIEVEVNAEDIIGMNPYTSVTICS